MHKDKKHQYLNAKFSQLQINDLVDTIRVSLNTFNGYLLRSSIYDNARLRMGSSQSLRPDELLRTCHLPGKNLSSLNCSKKLDCFTI